MKTFPEYTAYDVVRTFNVGVRPRAFGIENAVLPARRGEVPEEYGAYRIRTQKKRR